MEMVFEEDICQAVSDCETGLGYRSGRMLEYGKNVLHNIRIMTKEHGVLWYGDFDMVEDMDRLKEAYRIINTKSDGTMHSYVLHIMLEDEWNLNKAFLVT